MPLPPSVATGTVVGTFLDLDGNPIVGATIRFRPSPSRLLVPSEPATILPGRVTVATDANGQINVPLIATDDPDVNPTGWTWSCTIDIPRTQWAAQPYGFCFELAAGSIVDLTEVTPVSASGGTPIVQGPPGILAHDALGDPNTPRPAVPASTVVLWTNTPTEPVNIGPNDLWADMAGPVIRPATPPPPPEPDSFLTTADIGPRATTEGGDGLNIQWWGTAFTQGFQFRPTVDVNLLGARWWLVADNTLTTTSGSINIAQATAAAPPIASKAWAPPPPPAAGPSGWETVLFDTPVALTAGVEYVVWVEMVHPDNVNVARTPNYFTDGQASRFGLLEAVQPTAWFNSAAAESQVPAATTDAWYWLDPLVEPA